MFYRERSCVEADAAIKRAKHIQVAYDGKACNNRERLTTVAQFHNEELDERFVTYTIYSILLAVS